MELFQYIYRVYFIASKTQEFMCVEQIYVRKVKLFLTFNPNISSEIVDFQENGGVGDTKTQIPYFPL